MLKDNVLTILTDSFSWQKSAVFLYLLKYPQAIVYRFQTRFNQVDNYTHPEIILTSVEDYAVDVQVGDRLLISWLRTTYQSILGDNPPFLVSNTPNLIDAEFFPIQYSHARCCAYLRQLEQEKIITEAGILIPNPNLIELLPYLNPFDWDLLKAIVSLNDEDGEIYTPKLINHLSQAVLNFERYSGIWRENLQLKPIKAILLILARYYLHFFLQKSSVIPPVEL